MLAFESGGDFLSVALVQLAEAATGRAGQGEGWRLLGETTVHRGHRHADTLLDAASALLGSHELGPRDVDLLAAGRGPGGFTGVRVGLATALGLGMGTGKPVWPVPSLEALLAPVVPSAVAAPGGDHVWVPMLDARRQEVYAGAYRLRPDGAGLEELVAPSVGPPADVLEALSGCGVAGAPRALLGSGALVHGLATPGLPPGWHRPSAWGVALVSARAWNAAGRPAEGPPVDPAYLRPSDAEMAHGIVL